MIELAVFNTLLENSKTEDGLYHYIVEEDAGDGLTHHTLINKHMSEEEMQALYEFISTSYQLDPDSDIEHPKFIRV